MLLRATAACPAGAAKLQHRSPSPESHPLSKSPRFTGPGQKGEAGDTGKPRNFTPWADKPGRSPSRASQAAGRGSARLARATPELDLLYGFHSVREALKAGRRKLVRLHATSAAAQKLGDEIAASKIPVNLVSGEDISASLPQDAVHQGVLLEARPIALIDISEIASVSGLVLVLDQITDPHNVGAILRTAAAFGVDALVTTERHLPEFSGVLAKAASGGLEHVAIVSVVNLSRALTELGEMGYLRVGLDSDGTETLDAMPLQRPLALVLGAEGKGLRRLTRERCDAMARLDMPGPVKSLNVSNACAIALTIAQARAQSRG